jgi:hypothetical protein
MSYQSEVLADNPVLYWRLNELGGVLFADSSGHGRVGLSSGSPALQQDSLIGTDPDNKSVRFDGVNDYIHDGSAVALSASGRTTFSVECWIKTTVIVPPGERRYVLDKPKSAFGAYQIWFDNTFAANGLIFGFGKAPNTILLGQANNRGLNDGFPHHLVMTHAADGIRLYVDGTLDEFRPNTDPLIEDNNLFSFRIGAQGPEFGGIEGWFPGVIDEVAVYFSTLSAVRTQAHFAASHIQAPGVEICNPVSERPVWTRYGSILAVANNCQVIEEIETEYNFDLVVRPT